MWQNTARGAGVDEVADAGGAVGDVGEVAAGGDSVKGPAAAWLFSLPPASWLMLARCS